MSVKFSNNATTELASSIGTSDTSITVVDASKFPILTAGDYTYVTLDTDTASPTREIVKVTAISGNVLTVTRGMDGTSPASFAAGTKVELRLTAALLNDVAGANPSGEPIGFPDKSQTTITFDSGTRTFSITPTGASFDVYCKGVKYTYTTVQLVTIPNTTGLHFIYFDASGVLSTQMSYFTWEEHAPTAYVYWNATTQQAVYFGDERHGITLDWQTHEYLHRTRGAAIASGFSASNYTTTGLGATDADAQIDIGGGTFFDEDMQVDIVSTNTPVAGTWQQDLAGPARIPVLYLSGSAWVIDAPTNFPFKVVSGIPQYNLYSSGTWSTASVTNNSYFVSWILATNNLTYPVVSIISQAPTNQLSVAEAMTFEGLNLNGFPSVEFRPLYKVIYQYKEGFTNSVKSSTIAVYDLRSLQSAGVAAALVQDHGNLSGLVDDDHPQYVHVSEVRTPSAAVKNSFFPSQVGQTGKYLSTDGTNTVWEPAPSGSLSFTGDVTGTGSTGSSVSLTLAASGVVAGQYTKVTVDAKGRVTAATSIASSDVTTALGYTPYNSSNPAGYLTGITGTQVTTALGYTPPQPNGTGATGTWGISITGNAATVTNGLYKSGVNAVPAAIQLNTTADNWMWLLQAGGGNDWYWGPSTANFGIGANRLAISSSGGSADSELVLERGTTRLLEVLQANLQYKGNVVLHAGNYSSYALPLSGGTLTGNLTGTRFTPSGSTNGAYIHSPNDWGIRFTNNDGWIQIGPANTGWCHIYGSQAFYFNTDLYSNGHLQLHANNYSSYALPLSGGTLTGSLFGTLGSFSGAVEWGNGSSVMNAGNPRSLRIGYSGGNYGAAGYGITFTTSSGVHNYALNDIVSWWEAYDGIRVYAAAAGAVGTPITWTTVLDARRNNSSLIFKGQTVLDAGNVSGFAIPASTNLQSTDLNQAYNSGLYGFDIPSANTPGFSYGHLLVMRGRGDTIGQLAIDYSSGAMAFRGAYLPNGSSTVGAVWSSWRRALDSSNYNSYSPTLTGSGASGTWGISVTGSAGSASTATRSTIEDTRAAQRTPDDYEDYRASYEFTDRLTGLGDWHTAFTMQGWHNAYAAWQIIGPASTSAHENFYLRSGVNSTWNPIRTILHSGNYSSYALPLSGGTLTGSRPIEISTSGGYIAMTAANGGGWSMGTYYKGSSGTIRAGFGALGNENDLNYAWIGTGYDGAWMTLTPTSIAVNADFQLGSNYLRFDQSGVRSWNMRATGGNLDLLSGDGLGSFRYNGGVILTSNNVSSYALPIGGGNLTGQTTLSAGHNDTRFQLRYVHGGDVNSGGSGYLTMWASEPGISYAYTGIGANINVGGQYYGRQSTGQTYGVYIRWDTASGQTQFWNTTATPGPIDGQGTMRAFVASDGELYATASAHKVLHAGNYGSYALPLSGGTVSGTLSVSSAYGTMAAVRGSYFGYSSGYGAVILGSTAGYQTTCIGVDPIANQSGAFSGVGHEVMFRNGVAFITPNSSNNGYHTYFTMSGGVADYSAALRQAGNQVLHAGNYTSYSPSLTGSGASGTWGIRITGFANQGTARLYSTDASYNYDAANPYFGYLTYDGSRWLFQVSPGTPAAVRVSYADSAGSADQIDGWGFVNTGSNAGINADTLASNGITYYTGGVPNFTGNSTDGALYSQVYSGDWQHQIAGDYRSGQIALRGKNAGSWQSWRTVLDSGNYTSYAVGISNNSSLNSDSRNTRGVTRLYRRDDNSDYSVQTYWTGSHWYLAGYSGDNFHADCRVAYADTVGGRSPGSSAGNIAYFDSSNGYLYTPTWIGIGGGNGLFSSSGTNGAHFYPSTATHCTWQINGSKGGYTGISCLGSSHYINWMVDTGGNLQGWYNQSYGWQMYWSGGTLTVFKNTYGGGTAATVLDSSNYSSYALPISGGTVTGEVSFTKSTYPAFIYGNANTGSASSVGLQIYSTGGNGAIMAFHRGSYYAVNMGLDSDNVIRIGGWSASANRWQLDMSGNGTYAGNVTAYSDERLKKDWSPIESGFVDRLASILAGTYTRIDSGERQAGVSAQKMREILPEVVSEDNEGTLALAYGNAAMVSAVELAKELVTLKKELAELKSRLH